MYRIRQYCKYLVANFHPQVMWIQARMTSPLLSEKPRRKPGWQLSICGSLTVLCSSCTTRCEANPKKCSTGWPSWGTRRRSWLCLMSTRTTAGPGWRTLACWLSTKTCRTRWEQRTSTWRHGSTNSKNFLKRGWLNGRVDLIINTFKIICNYTLFTLLYFLLYTFGIYPRWQ